jgi:hypothetical protein
MGILEHLTPNNIQWVILFVAPGFISLKIWGLIHPSQKLVLSESILEALIFSCFNYGATIWVYFLMKDADCFWVYFLVLFIFSLGCPVLLKCLLSIKFLKNKIINIMPKSWDYFFNKRECCFMLIHINDGKIIGGLYGPDSFASSYPEKEDVYLQETWKIDENGRFIKKIADTKGLLINPDVIEYIELFDINNKEK